MQCENEGEKGKGEEKARTHLLEIDVLEILQGFERDALLDEGVRKVPKLHGNQPITHYYIKKMERECKRRPW